MIKTFIFECLLCCWLWKKGWRFHGLYLQGKL